MAIYNYTVIVAASSTYGQNVYLFDGVEKPPLNLSVGDTVNLDISNQTVFGHPLVFGANNGSVSPSYESSDGVTYTVNGTTYSTTAAYITAYSSITSGQPASISWTVQSSVNVNSWYFCAYHSNMGNSIFISNGTDYDAPANTSIVLESGAASTYNTTIDVTLSATDNIGVNGYYLSNSNTIPAPADFTSVLSTSNYNDTVQHDLDVSSGLGTKTVYAWFKDNFDNISNTISSSIILASSDTTKPYNTSISINSGDTSTNSNSVSVAISAQDDVGITGYYLSETNTEPSINSFITVPSNTNYSDIVSFSLSPVNGTHYIYVWFKDFGENISTAISDSIELSIPDSDAPINVSLVINAVGPVNYNANGIKITNTYQVYCVMSGFDTVGVTGYYLSESSATPSLEDFIPTYSSQSFSQTAIFELVPSNLPVTLEIKTIYLWLRDAEGNISSPVSNVIELDTTSNDPAEDIFMPTNNGLTILNGDNVDTRLITCNISGSDNSGITGYYISESPNFPHYLYFISTGSTPQTSIDRNVVFSLSQLSGDKILHLWFIDANQNISMLSTDTVHLNFVNAGEANFMIKDGILGTNRPGVVQSRTIPSNMNELFIGPTQISNSIDIQGTLAVFNEFDIVEGGDVNITGTLDLR